MNGFIIGLLVGIIVATIYTAGYLGENRDKAMRQAIDNGLLLFEGHIYRLDEVHIKEKSASDDRGGCTDPVTIDGQTFPGDCPSNEPE